jgi:hypothetical protein
VLSGLPVYSTTATSASPVGTYSVSAAGGLTATNYSFSFAPGTLTVTKAVLTITVNASTKVYGAALPTFGYTASNFVNGDTAAVLSGLPVYSTTATSASPVGTYSVSSTGGLTATNYSFSYVAGTLTVGKAVLTITVNASAKVYGAALPTFGYTASNFVNSDTAAVLSGLPVYSTTATSASPVGTYSVSATTGALDATNYSFSFVSGTLTVSKAVLTITVNAASKVYGTANPAFSFTASNFVNGDTAAVLSGAPTYSCAALVSSAVGTYQIGAVATGLVSTNYSYNVIPGSLTISPAPLTLTIANVTRTYGAVTPSFSYTVAGLVNGETTAVLFGTPVYSCAAVATSPIGTYPITAALGTLAAGNYSITFVSGTLTVAPAILTVQADAKTKVYGANLPALTFTVTGFLNGETSAIVTGSANVTTTATATSSVGTYPITAAADSLSAANYAFVYLGSNLTITPATLNIGVSNAAKVYGAALPAFSFTVTGLVNGDLASVITGAPTYSTSATLSSPVGTYAITAVRGTLSATNYSFTFSSGTLTVNQAPLTFTATNKTKVYGSANPSLDATVAGFVLGQTISSLTGEVLVQTSATTASPVGTYPITVTQNTLIAPNYSLTFVDGTLSVTKTVLTVTANGASREYGQANPSFSVFYTGFLNGDTASVLTGSVSYSTLATATSSTGFYFVTPVKNTLDAANYSFTFVAGTLTITKATARLTVNPASRAYGVVNPSFTYAVADLLNGDLAAVITGTPTYSTTATLTSNVGVYPVSMTNGSLNATNYTFTFFDGNLTVTKANLVVTPNAATRAYGAVNPSFTFGVTGLKNSDTIAVVSGTPVYSTNDTVTSPVGPYVITATRGSLDAINYDFSFSPGVLSVSKAILTLHVTDKTRNYGASLPAGSYVVSGLLNGDTASVISGAPVYSSTAVVRSPIGTYPFTATDGTLSAANYSFAFTAGTLTITPATLLVTAQAATKTYGAAHPSFTSNITGFISGDSAALVSGAAAYVTSVTATTPLGQYTVTPERGTLSAPNYTFTYASGQYTVTAATLTARVNDQSRLYGAANPAFTTTITGFMNGETVSVVSGTVPVTTSATVYHSVGTYALIGNFSQLTSPNYIFVGVNGTLTIGKTEVIVKPDNLTRAYGDANPTPTASYIGFMNSESISVAAGSPNLTIAATVTSPVGTYVIDGQPGTLVASNYTFVAGTGVLTVQPAVLLVTGGTASRVYGDINPSVSFTVTGFRNGDAASVVTGTPAFTTTATATSPVGTYAVTLARGNLAATNYSFTYANGSLTVTRAAVTVKANDQIRPYGSANQSFVHTFTGLRNGETASVVTGAPTFTTTAVATSPVGTYPIVISITGLTSTNYTFTPVDGVLTVGKATLTLTANNKTRQYGSANPALDFTYSGFVNGETAAVLTGAATATTTATITSPVGTYPIVPDITGVSSINYAFTPVAGVLTINPALLTVRVNNVSRFYGVANPSFTHTLEGLVLGDQPSAVTGAPIYSTTATIASPVGYYDVTATRNTLAAANYTFAFIPGILTIDTSAITVSSNPASRIYGAANPVFTASFSGFLNGDNSNVISGTPLFTPAATSASPVGEYAVTVSRGSLSSVNYHFTFTAGVLTVGQATLTVTANNASRVYGSANPGFSATITGFVNGDDAGAVSGAPAFSTTATLSSTVGNYIITPARGDLASTNYRFVYAVGNLEITKREIIVRPTDVSKVYGSTLQGFAVTYTGFVNGDTTAALNGTPTMSSVATQFSPVGIYSITADLTNLSATNYRFTSVNGTLTITTAVLAVHINNGTRVYGEVDPTFTYSFVGFIGSDNANAISGTPAFTTTASLSSPAGGTYSINGDKGSLSADNYTFTFTPGVLSITKAPIVVAAVNLTRTYGVANPEFLVSYTGFKNSETQSVFSAGTKPTLSTTATTTSPVGVYVISAVVGTLDALNYSFTCTGGTLTIEHATLTVRANNLSREYGVANPTPEHTITGYLLSDTATVVSGQPSLSHSAALNSAPGSYTISVTRGTLASTNYRFEPVAGTLTINKATPVGTFASRTITTAMNGTHTVVAGNLNATFAHATSMTVTAPTQNVSYQITAGAPVIAGTTQLTSGDNALGQTVYSVQANFAADANYAAASATAQFTVQAPLTTLTLTAAPNGAGNVNPSVESTYRSATSHSISATANALWVFDRWSILSGSGSFANARSATTTWTLNGPATLQANFIKQGEFNGSATVGGTMQFGTAVNEMQAGGSRIYTMPVSIQLVATPSVGYRFGFWTQSGGSINDTMAMSAQMNATSESLSADGSTFYATANFIKTFTLEIGTATGGTASATPAAATYDIGSAVAIVATPAAGYRFDHWAGDTAGLASITLAETTVTMNGDYTLTPVFVKVWHLNVSSNGNGSVTGAGIYDQGQRVTVTATSVQATGGTGGTVFTGWTGLTAPDNATITNPEASVTTITIPASDVSIYATFTSTDGTGVVTLPGNASFSNAFFNQDGNRNPKSSSKTLVLTNSGNMNLIVDSVTGEAPFFPSSTGPSFTSIELAPNQSVMVAGPNPSIDIGPGLFATDVITFIPEEAIQYNSRIAIVSDDPANPLYILNVSGLGMTDYITPTLAYTGPATVHVDGTITMSMSMTYANPQGFVAPTGTITYTIVPESTTPGVVANVQNGDQLRPTAIGTGNGTLGAENVITVRADYSGDRTGGGGGFYNPSSTTFTVTVPNRAPTISVGQYAPVNAVPQVGQYIFENDTLYFRANVADADRNLSSVTLTVTDDQGTVVATVTNDLTGTNTGVLERSVVVPGTDPTVNRVYTVTASVTDMSGAVTTLNPPLTFTSMGLSYIIKNFKAESRPTESVTPFFTPAESNATYRVNKFRDPPNP